MRSRAIPLRGGVQFKREKLKELLLYIAQKCADEPTFGATKLNKVLFFADFLHYAQHGKPITGATYQRLDHGPAPKELLPIRKELEQEGAAILVEQPLSSPAWTQRRLVARREPDLDVFTSREIALVDDMIRMLRNLNAKESSNLSHEQCSGWRLAGDREEIPYHTVFLTIDEPATSSDVRRGQELAQRYGWA